MAAHLVWGQDYEGSSPFTQTIGESVNGKPAVSKTATQGSSPCSPAIAVVIARWAERAS